MRFAMAFCWVVTLASLTVEMPVLAGDKTVKIEQQWQGRISKEKAELAPKQPYLDDAKAAAKLWKDWEMRGTPPKVDFDKQALLVLTATTSVLEIVPRLTPKGTLILDSMGTDDKTKDFAYHIALVKRTGVKRIQRGSEK